ncbi:helix-turn-helix domain-containing protein [Kribbella sp. NBC_00709]|uniref:GlxA family transcriptional regulator n=1 Tax=Kribbella sp. NBC_00709 TaxID=2975972 RepID=UPI002E2957F2|nr:helix-turn-helix domain-containing protein [Kribbella sp. NBC_00709]
MVPLRISILAYPGCFASEVYGVPDLLTMATRVAQVRGSLDPAYDVRIVSPRRRVLASGGTRVDVSPLRPSDVLVVPGFEVGPAVDVDRVLSGLGPELAAIRAHTAGGAAVVSICLGAFLLAEAGALDRRTATTSWLYADQLARRYPAVDVRADELVITDRGATTTAAFSAMYDFALTLIRRHSGASVARATARIALVDDARTSQAPYVDHSILPAAGSTFADQVKRWLDQHLDNAYDLERLAAELHVSSRTLLRRFGTTAGVTPLEYLQAARVRRAGQLLETTGRTVARIAGEVGYRDPASFSRLFRRHTGKAPGEYRAQFRRTT